MAVGLIPAVATALLNGTDTGGLDDYVFIQLHDGDPGAAGTANVATESDRVTVGSYTVAAGQMSNAAAAEWASVAATETYTHFSAWDAATLGACGFTGTITAPGVIAGDNFIIEIGDLVVTFALAA